MICNALLVLLLTQQAAHDSACPPRVTVETYVVHLDATHCNKCNILRHTAAHCNTLQHTATHCNTLQHSAIRCTGTTFISLQLTATHCNILHHTVLQYTATHCNTLHYNTLQLTATLCNTLQHTATHSNATNYNTMQHTASYCITPQHFATHCNTLQHTATHYNNTPQHTATHCITLQHNAAAGGRKTLDDSRRTKRIYMRAQQEMRLVSSTLGGRVRHLYKLYYYYTEPCAVTAVPFPPQALQNPHCFFVVGQGFLLFLD